MTVALNKENEKETKKIVVTDSTGALFIFLFFFGWGRKMIQNTSMVLSAQGHPHTTFRGTPVMA